MPSEVAASISIDFGLSILICVLMEGLILKARTPPLSVRPVAKSMVKHVILLHAKGSISVYT